MGDNSIARNRFEDLLGQAIEYAVEYGISADYARKALVDDWELIMAEKMKRDKATLKAAV